MSLDSSNSSQSSFSTAAVLSYVRNFATAKCPCVKILLVYISMGKNSYIEYKSLSTTVLICATLLEVAARHLNFIIV